MPDTLLLDSDTRKENLIRHEKQKFQGSWNYVSGLRKAHLLVAGDHFTMEFANGDIYVGSFLVDPTRRPKAMDVLIAEGPERHRGKTARCIYEFDGDYLIWAPNEPGSEERLPAFPPGDDTHHLCIVFRREKASRPTL